MNSIRITDLPDLLFDAQRADACAQRYPQKEYVFTADKWRDLVNKACKSGELPATTGTVETSSVNRWLAEADLDLWSSFQIHEPLSPDLSGQFEKSFSDIDQAHQERIKEAEPTLVIKWDKISPSERQRIIDDADSVRSPRTRLFFAIGDVVLWGSHLNPPEQTLLEAASKEAETWASLQPNDPTEKQLHDTKQAEIDGVVQHIEAIRDKLLSGRFDEADATTEMINLLAENSGTAWCRNVRFPVWLNHTSRENLPPAQNTDQTSKKQTDGQRPPRNKQRKQEAAIIQGIMALGHDPKELPPNQSGYSGISSKVREYVYVNFPDLFQKETTVFKKAWERMSANKDIRYQSPSPPKKIQ